VTTDQIAKRADGFIVSLARHTCAAFAEERTRKIEGIHRRADQATQASRAKPAEARSTQQGCVPRYCRSWNGYGDRRRSWIRRIRGGISL